MTLTVIWYFLLGACELTLICVCEGKKCSNLAVNIGHHCTKYSHPGDQVPGILFTPAVLNNACKNFDYYPVLHM